jgi:hypothetical protein
VLVRQIGVLIDQPSGHHQVTGDIGREILWQRFQIRLGGAVELGARHVLRDRRAGVPPRPCLVCRATAPLERPAIVAFRGPAIVAFRGPALTAFRGPALTAFRGPAIVAFRAPASATGIVSALEAAAPGTGITTLRARSLTALEAAAPGTGITTLRARSLTTLEAAAPGTGITTLRARSLTTLEAFSSCSGPITAAAACAALIVASGEPARVGSPR